MLKILLIALLVVVGALVVTGLVVRVLVARGKRDKEAVDKFLGDQSNRRPTAAGSDPVCSQCGTTYNRGPVIRELKKIEPMAFSFEYWTVKFKCQRCGAVIPVSGSRSEASCL